LFGHSSLPPAFQMATRSLLKLPAAHVLKRPAFRMASNLQEVRSTTASGVGGAAVYESGKAVDEYLQFHYASDQEIMPFACGPKDALGFPKRMAAKCLAASGRKRALDLGCAVGGSSFELCRHFDRVVGVDFSQAFVDAAAKMATQGRHEYTSVIQADISEARTARVPDGIDRSRAEFRQGDACALPSDLGTFDAVLAGNLLCRLPDPQAFLFRCKQLVTPGGVLVLVSPYSWLEEYTPKSHWLGGHLDKSGVPQGSAAAVSALLNDSFVLETEEDMPFLIREHERKFQWACSHGAVWRRR